MAISYKMHLLTVGTRRKTWDFTSFSFYRVLFCFGLYLDSPKMEDVFILVLSKTIIMISALKLKHVSNGFTRALAVELNHYLRGFFIMSSIQFWGVSAAVSPCGTWFGLFFLPVSCSVSPADLLFACLPVWNINILICCSTL